MKIGIYSQKFKPSYVSVLKEIFSFGVEKGWDFYVEEKFLENALSYMSFRENIVGVFTSVNDLNEDFSLMLTIGGDGTILRVMNYIQHLPIPVLGINAGRLGFLATASAKEITNQLEQIAQGNFYIQQRTVLQMKVIGDNNIQMKYALNEVSVIRKNTTAMITIDTFLDDDFLTSYWADGLLIATPTGSTGYSLSCGGPVMLPESKSLVVTPVAPHNLNARPLIIPEDTKIRIKVHSREGYFLTSFDAQLLSLPCQKEILVEKAPFNLQMVAFNSHSFIDTLREKLLWNEDYRTQHSN